MRSRTVLVALVGLVVPVAVVALGLPDRARADATTPAATTPAAATPAAATPAAATPVPIVDDWTRACAGALHRAARAWDGDNPQWWSWRVADGAIAARYDADVDICGVWDDFRVSIAATAAPDRAWRSFVQPHGDDPAALDRRLVRVAAGRRVLLRSVRNDGGDFDRFVALFRPALDACLAPAASRRR